MTTTQNARVLAYMQEYGSISPVEALRDLGVMRLASRISDLRQIGFQIRKDIEKANNRYGETTHYARYSLIKAEEAHTNA